MHCMPNGLVAEKYEITLLRCFQEVMLSPPPETTLLAKYPKLEKKCNLVLSTKNPSHKHRVRQLHSAPKKCISVTFLLHFSEQIDRSYRCGSHRNGDQCS